MTIEPKPSGKPLPLLPIFSVFALIGMLAFIVQAAGSQPVKAWQAYLVNFLVFSAIAQGAVLFSALMHITRARWSGPLADVAESFAAFFPVSLVLFVFLFIGSPYVFPWLHEDMHGREVWFNLPFLFCRDFAGLALLYGLGLAYLYHALWFKLAARGATGPLGRRLLARWQRKAPDSDRFARRMTVYGSLYLLAFALVLSLIGYDLVMGMDPHWYSTLFGAYTFVKSIYVGFGALIILAAVLHVSPRTAYGLQSSQFHDIGKLFFAFCLVWGDFFYAQLVVIWYGNLSEETAYVIQRTVTAPWSHLAWTLFIGCFILPFLILLNKKFKTWPLAMSALCAVVIVGIWLEHFLLLGPVYYPSATRLPITWVDGLVALGFLGLLAAAVTVYLRQFPELLRIPAEERP
jgi:hypothetical protein